MNRAIVSGNLGRDPEVRYTSGGQAVANFSVATSRKYKKGDEWVEETEWHDITVWGKLAEVCGEHLAKGRKVLVEGRLKTDKWEKDGVKRQRTSIIAENVEFLTPKSAGGGSGRRENEAPPLPDNDDIPF